MITKMYYHPSQWWKDIQHISNYCSARYDWFEDLVTRKVRGGQQIKPHSGLTYEDSVHTILSCNLQATIFGNSLCLCLGRGATG